MHTLAGLAALLLVVGASPAESGARPQQPRTLSKGVGPVKEVKLGPIDPELAEKGGKVFEEKCSACHKLDERYVGPALRGVTTRRTPEWIMNMILNPQGMLQEDPTAQELLAEYFVPMTFQNVSQADARAILEYLRLGDRAGQARGDSESDSTRERR